MSTNPLNDISKVYLDQIAEKKKDDTYLEPDMKKRQANNEKARKELAKGPQMKNPHFEEKRTESDIANSLADAYKAVHQVDENRAAARAAGGYKDDSKKQNDPSKAGFTGVGNMSIDQIRKMSARMDKEKVKKEALDPVGKEDGDIDNDGDKDSSDKYLLKRRKAIGNAMKKKLKESRSLSEVMTDTDSETIVKEKKVNNKIKINPKLGEAVEEMGGSLIEHIEIDEMDFIIESVYDELLEEGYAEDDVEEAIENAMEATVTFGSDTKPMKKDGSQVGSRRKFLKRKAGEFLQKSKKKVGMAVAQARVDAYNKKREVKQAAKDKVNQKKQGLKNFIKNKAQKVVDRMSEEVEVEEYIDEAPYQVMGSPDGKKEKKIGKPVKSRKYADSRAAELADTHKTTGGQYRSKYVEEVEVEEYVDFLITEGYDCSDLTWDDMYEEYQSLDEGLRSAVKRLLGKKKEEPAKPMSRGDQLRKKYNVGPEKSDTSAKAQILKKTRAKADSDQKEFGGSRYSKGVADKSKAAHERQLKGGYSKYGADDARGKGNKARKRAAALTKEELEQIEELHKGRHGQTEKQYQDSRSDAGKMVSGDSKMSGSKYAQGRRTGSDAGPQTAGGSKKPASQGKMDSGSRTDLTFRKAALKKKAAEMKEDASMSPQELQLQKKKARIDRMIAMKRSQNLSKEKAGGEIPAKAMGEATEDSLRDRRMERGGVDGNNRYNKPVSNTPNTFGKKKPADGGMSALEKVKASIRAKHGDGAIKEDAKMAKQSDEKLAALHKQVSSSDQSLPSNQFMMKRVSKEMNRRKKAT